MKDGRPNTAPGLLIASLIVMMYFAAVVVPYADKNDFFSTNGLPEMSERRLFFVMSTPVFAIYIVYVCRRFSQIVFPRGILYPLLGINLYSGVFICALVLGAAVLWLMVITILFAAALVAGTALIGICQDIAYLRKKRDEQYPEP